MSKTFLDVDLAPLTRELLDTLRKERDPVRQQQILELLITNHVMRMGNKKAALVVAEGIHKHVRQLIEQFDEFSKSRA